MVETARKSVLRQKEMCLEAAEVEAGMDKADCLSGKADKTLCGKRVFAGIKEAELWETKEFLRAQGD